MCRISNAHRETHKASQLSRGEIITNNCCWCCWTHHIKLFYCSNFFPRFPIFLPSITFIEGTFYAFDVYLGQEFVLFFILPAKSFFTCAIVAMKTTPEQINAVKGAIHVRICTTNLDEKNTRRQIDLKNAVAASDLSHFNDDTIVCIKLPSGLVWGEKSR